MKNWHYYHSLIISLLLVLLVGERESTLDLERSGTHELQSY
jgi:hypothetical protein